MNSLNQIQNDIQILKQYIQQLTQYNLQNTTTYQNLNKSIINLEKEFQNYYKEIQPKETKKENLIISNENKQKYENISKKLFLNYSNEFNQKIISLFLSFLQKQENI